ncbi:MAG TPA: hypothetical protein GYA07_16750 [Verrucomicrobia bacterium]|nr:hypothetical protein [Verrucomicrobiota bacterium]
MKTNALLLALLFTATPAFAQSALPGDVICPPAGVVRPRHRCHQLTCRQQIAQ